MDCEQHPSKQSACETDERCPLGFAVRKSIEQQTLNDCGHAKCYPSACERLRRFEESQRKEREQ